MKKKRHHFIPKLILRNFADSNKIFLYRHNDKKIYRNSIENAFTKNNLNSLTDKVNEVYPNLIEDIYDKYFENPASKTIKKIINDIKQVPPSGKDFSAADYLSLIRFAIISNFRTPYSLDNTHHAIKVGCYAMIILKYFMDFDTVDFPYDLDFDKGILFNYLRDFDEATKLLLDLKLTLYYHSLQDSYFILPDQFAIIFSPNYSKLADKELKIYFPISSNIVVCFERINRDFSQGVCEIDKYGVEKLNLYFANNSFDAIGCQNESYLLEFTNKFEDRIIKLKKFDPYEDFTKVKQQIKLEILQKLVMERQSFDIERGIITQINRNHEFRILSEREYNESISKLNCSVNINRRKFLI